MTAVAAMMGAAAAATMNYAYFVFSQTPGSVINN
jgi:hypothetical protein